MVVLVVVVGLGAALFLALGWVIQQHAASRAPAEERLSLRILWDLLHRPLWLCGIAAMVVGQLLGAVALGRGSLTLVEPLLAANLLFALPLAAAWSRRRLGLREWAGAVILVVGLAMFVVAAGPEPDQATVVVPINWIISAATIVVVVGALIAVGKGLEPVKQATLIALGAGILYGMQDGLTQRTLLNMNHFGVFGMLGTWQPYALVAVAVAGLTLAQSAFEAAPLAASLPAITIAEPITGIGLGAGLFSQKIRSDPASLSLEVLGIFCMVIGVLMVARSPIVTGSHHKQRGTGTRRVA